MSKVKKESWRIVVGVIAIGYIIFTWVQKDVLQQYGSMPAEQALPMIVTTVAVSLLKVALLAGVIFLVKWLIGKFKK